jgi:hypothetical protein
MTSEKRILLRDELVGSSLSSSHNGTGFSPPYTFCTTSFTSYKTEKLKLLKHNQSQLLLLDFWTLCTVLYSEKNVNILKLDVFPASSERVGNHAKYNGKLKLTFQG